MFIRILTAVLLPTLVVVVLAGASCKKTQNIETPAGDLNVTTDGTTVTIEDQEGSVQSTFGTGLTLPDNFPSDAPTYPGVNLTNVSSASNDSDVAINLVTWTTSDSRETIERWYRTELEKEGWDITFSNATPEATSLISAKGTRALSVTISVIENLTNISMTVTSAQ